MRVLVIAPHMDDEVLGPGATIARHVAGGDEVTVVVVANRAYGHEYDPELTSREKRSCSAAQGHLGYQNLINLELPDEKLDAQQIDIIIPIENVLNKASPEVVYIPHRGDYHQDHRAIADAMHVICRPYAETRVDIIRVYETTSSTGYAPSQSDWPFLPNWYVDVSKTLDRKIAAMACYEEEGRAYPHPRSPEGIQIHAQSRGMEVGLDAAEAFVSLRNVWR